MIKKAQADSILVWVSRCGTREFQKLNKSSSSGQPSQDKVVFEIICSPI